ncbi:MAG: hypothetical protein GXO75_15350 [Calditrichaeota bacterium]|nr:hypothetical protein [Calditrichota bacterium]
MKKQNDGGPAFPVIGTPGAPEDYPGMSLLDYFAATILQGLMLRYNEPAYSDKGAIREAYRLASIAIEIKEELKDD